MLEKIKSNLGKLTFVLSLVSAALLVPSVISIVFSTLTESTVITLIQYLLFLAVCGAFLLPKTDIKMIVPIANAVFYGALALRHIYSAITGGYSAYATAALYTAVAVLIFIPKCKKAYALTSLIAIAFFVASALGGGAVNLSTLLIAGILTANYYFVISEV